MADVKIQCKYEIHLLHVSSSHNLFVVIYFEKSNENKKNRATIKVKCFVMWSETEYVCTIEITEVY